MALAWLLALSQNVCGYSPKNYGKAPEFNLEDLKGHKSILTNKKSNKVLIIDFWRLSCAYCIKGIPDYIELSNKYDKSDLAFVTVNIKDEPSKVKKFLSKRQEKWPVLFDRDGKVSKLYGVRALPTVILIDKNKNVRGFYVGYNKDKSQIIKDIEILLKEQ